MKAGSAIGLLQPTADRRRPGTPEIVGDLRGQLGDGLQHVVLDAVHTMPADNPDLLATSVREFIAEGRARAKAHVFPRA